MTIPNYHVLIAGAGPAGVSIALRLSETKKFDIAILDVLEENNIGKKSCGDALLEKWIPDPILVPQGVELCNQWEMPDVYIGTERVQGVSTFESGFVVNRHAYNQRLLKIAKERGVKVYPHRRVEAAIIDKGDVIGLRTKNLITKGQEIFLSSVVIDTTGWSHAVRKSLNLEEFSRIRTVTPNDQMVDGYREILRVEHDFDNHFYWVYLDKPQVPGSYFWILGHGPNEVNAGVYIHKGANDGKIKSIYQKVLHEMFFKPDMYEVLDSRGCPIPSALPLTNVVANGLVILGESALHTNPLSGEGFGPAIWAAWKTGNTILEALNAGDVSEKKLWHINKELVPLMISNTIAFCRRKAFESFGIPGLEILTKRIADKLGALFTDKDLSAKDQLKTALKLRNLKMLKELLIIQLRAKQIKKIFSNYPESNENYGEWKKYLERVLTKYDLLELPKKESFDYKIKDSTTQDKPQHEKIILNKI